MDGQRQDGTLALQTIAMPADTNESGDIFGGWLMAQMDLGGAVPARVRAKGRVATVAVDGMAFHRPVRVGDVVTIYADIVREGATSMTVDVQVWATRKTTHLREKVTEATFVYVAVDQNGVKRPLPPLEP